jgi:hypothetical protein
MQLLRNGCSRRTCAVAEGNSSKRSSTFTSSKAIYAGSESRSSSCAHAGAAVGALDSASRAC